MPIKAYYRGHGESVLARMIREYGAKRGRQIFYATAQKRGLTPAKTKPKR